MIPLLPRSGRQVLTRFARTALVTAALTVSLSAAAEKVRFPSPQIPPGQALRSVAESRGNAGTITLRQDGTTTRGSLETFRQRDLVWTVPAAIEGRPRQCSVYVHKLASRATARIQDQEENENLASSLQGTSLRFQQLPSGRWQILNPPAPDKSAASRDDLEEILALLHRKWYPDQPVAIGESWPFDPLWLRHVVQKDLQHARTEGRMKLIELRPATDGSQLAVIDATITSRGLEAKPAGREDSIRVDLKGRIIFHLASGIEQSIDLQGRVVTETRTAGGTVRRVDLPVHLEIRKTLVPTQR
jgi:hypothetical protein